MKNGSAALAFVDTNILHYAFYPDEPAKTEIARHLVRTLGDSNSGCISTQVLLEFASVAIRKSNASSGEIADALAWMNTWPLHRPALDDIVMAVELRERHQLSIWDAMIVNSAATLGCTTLYTEDLNHGQTIAGVVIVNPFRAAERTPEPTTP